MYHKCRRRTCKRSNKISFKYITFYKQNFVNNFLLPLNTCIGKKCFCGIQKTDLQFKEEFPGESKTRQGFVFTAALTHSQTTIYTMCDKMYYIVYLCYIKWFFTLTNFAFSLFIVQTKTQTKRMYATRQFHLYTYVIFIVYENFFSPDFMIVNAKKATTLSP